MLYFWIAVQSRDAMYAFAVVYDLATGATQGMFRGSLMSLTMDLSKTGTRIGMVCSILAFASLTGPPIAGGLIQNDKGGYLSAQAWGGTAVMLGSLTVGAARMYKTGWKWKVKL